MYFFLSDSVSAEALENLEIFAQIENILYKSHKSGKSLKFYDREEVNAEKRQAGQAERNDDSESRTNICHLPKPVYRIIKEHALFDFEATRELLTSALACEGFGRGGKKLRYCVPENKPSWWDDDLEQIIGLKWSDFSGVNTKEYKGGKWKEAMHEIIVKIYRYHLGNEMDNYIQFRDENFEYKKTSRKPKPKKVAASNLNQETDLPKEGVAENELYQFPDNVLQYQYQVPQTPHVQLQAPQHQAPQHQAPPHQAPQHQDPQHQAPQHQTPQHQAPQFQFLPYQVPQYHAPQYQAQQFQNGYNTQYQQWNYNQDYFHMNNATTEETPRQPIIEDSSEPTDNEPSPPELDYVEPLSRFSELL